MRFGSPVITPTVRQLLAGPVILMSFALLLGTPQTGEAITTELVEGGLNRPVYVTGFPYDGYDRLFYSAERLGGLGTGIFRVDDSVKRHIVEQLQALGET